MIAPRCGRGLQSVRQSRETVFLRLEIDDAVERGQPVAQEPNRVPLHRRAGHVLWRRWDLVPEPARMDRAARLDYEIRLRGWRERIVSAGSEFLPRQRRRFPPSICGQEVIAFVQRSAHTSALVSHSDVPVLLARMAGWLFELRAHP